MSNGAIFEAKEICKTFNHPTKVEVLKSISFSLFPKETIAITGPSGSGKSTLIHILATLENPSSGTLLLKNEQITPSQFAKVRSHLIGIVFQSNHLLDEYTAIDNVLLKASIARKPIHKNSKSYKEALSLLDRVGLSHRAHFSTKLLSGGEKQRTSIARAMMNNPSIILADEPTGNLDQTTAKDIQSLLIQSCKETNTSLVVVTHDQTFAEKCDRILHLTDGLLEEKRQLVEI